MEAIGPGRHLGSRHLPLRVYPPDDARVRIGVSREI
jgi:hypothetical protein